jgi:hypothetical protein
MEAQLQSGQQVTVNAFGGKRPSVIVVEDRGEVVLVCKPEEFERAKVENRAPMAIGLPRTDVVGITSGVKKGVSSELPPLHERSQAGD